MPKVMRWLLLVLILPLAAQPPRANGVLTVWTMPAGVCSSTSPTEYYSPANQFFGCVLANSAALTGTWTQIAGTGAGTVTSVGLSRTDDTNVTATITGSPITTAGTINLAMGWTGTLAVSRGGIGVGTLTGIAKGNGTSAFSAAASTDVVGLFSGCSGTQYLGADGACHTPASGNLTVGSTTISSGTNTRVLYDNAGTLGEYSISGTGSVCMSSGSACAPTAALHNITFVIDGGGSAITTGDLGVFPTVDYSCTINRVDVSGSPSGSITVDIWKAAGAIPTSGNKISASAPATLSSSQLNQAGSISGWTTSVSSGDVFGGTVATVATVQRVTVQIWCQ